MDIDDFKRMNRYDSLHRHLSDDLHYCMVQFGVVKNLKLEIIELIDEAKDKMKKIEEISSEIDEKLYNADSELDEIYPE